MRTLKVPADYEQYKAENRVGAVIGFGIALVILIACLSLSLIIK